MAKVEDIVFVNDAGIINRFSSSRELQPGDNIAVELVMVYLPSKKQIVSTVVDRDKVLCVCYLRW